MYTHYNEPLFDYIIIRETGKSELRITNLELSQL